MYVPETCINILGSVISSKTCIRDVNSNVHSFISSLTCCTAILSWEFFAMATTAGTISGSSLSRWQTHLRIVLTPYRRENLQVNDYSLKLWKVDKITINLHVILGFFFNHTLWICRAGSSKTSNLSHLVCMCLKFSN